MAPAPVVHQPNMSRPVNSGGDTIGGAKRRNEIAPTVRSGFRVRKGEMRADRNSCRSFGPRQYLKQTLNTT